MVCKVCQKDKSETEFYSSNKNICKLCICERVREHRRKNIEKIRAYDRNRPNKAERNQKNKEYKARMRLEDPKKFDKIFHGARKNFRANHKDKSDAEGKLNDAIRYGKIKRPDTCSLCGVKCTPQAHHYDYSKPLNVVWVCVSCHANIHNRLRAIKRENKALVKIPIYDLASKVLDNKANA